MREAALNAVVPYFFVPASVHSAKSLGEGINKERR